MPVQVLVALKLWVSTHAFMTRLAAASSSGSVTLILRFSQRALSWTWATSQRRLVQVRLLSLSSTSIGKRRSTATCSALSMPRGSTRRRSRSSSVHQIDRLPKQSSQAHSSTSSPCEGAIKKGREGGEQRLEWNWKKSTKLIETCAWFSLWEFWSKGVP